MLSVCVGIEEVAVHGAWHCPFLKVQIVSHGDATKAPALDKRRVPRQPYLA